MAIAPIGLGDEDARAKINMDFARGNAHDIDIANAQTAINSLANTKAPQELVTPLLTNQNDLLRASGRPGDAPRLFTPSVGGGEPDVLGELPAVAITTSDGRVYPLTTAGVVAQRRYTVIEPGRVYEVRGDVRRLQNALDPSNDTVRLLVGWYTSSKVFISSSIAGDWPELTVADGRQTVTKRIARAAGTGIDLVAPAGAVYARVYFQVFGGSQQTALIYLDIEDVTDRAPFAADVTALQGQVDGLLSLNAGSRLDDLEAASSDPVGATYATLLSAQTASVPATVDLVRLLGATTAGDTALVRVFRARATEPSWQLKFQDALGRWFLGSEERPCLGLGWEYLTALRTALNTGAVATGGLLHIHIFGNSTMAEAGAGGGFDGSLILILTRMLRTRGVANFVIHSHAVGGTGYGDFDVSLVDGDAVWVIVKGETNEASLGLATFHAQAEAFISDLRTAHPMSDLSITVIGGHTTERPNPDWGWKWNIQHRAFYEYLCREYKAAFVDPFAAFPDAKAIAGITMDNPAVHPYVTHQVGIIGLMIDYCLGNAAMAMWAKNAVTNVEDVAEHPPASRVPSQWPYGPSCFRARAADSWPIDGAVYSFRSADGLVVQENFSYAAGVTRKLTRTANSGGDAWNRWTGVPEALTPANSWLDYGAGITGSSATLDAEGFVDVVLNVKSGTTTAGTTVTTLPAGMRPALDLFFQTIGSGLEIGRARISADGTIKIENGAWSAVLTTLNARFRAA